MTDKELAVLLPKLPLDQQIEHVICKYVGGASSRWRDGETPANIGDAGIAKDLVGKMKRFGVLPTVDIAQMGVELARAVCKYFGDGPIDPILDGDIRLRDMARSIVAQTGKDGRPT